MSREDINSIALCIDDNDRTCDQLAITCIDQLKITMSLMIYLARNTTLSSKTSFDQINICIVQLINHMTVTKGVYNSFFPLRQAH